MPPRRRWTSSEKRSVGAKQAWKCARCSSMLPATYEIDHVCPLHKGGLDCLETNAEALCNQCHANKTLNERMEMELLRTEAILQAKAAAGPVLAVSCPSRRPVLAPEPGLDFFENQFLKFAHVHTRRRN